MSDDWQSGTQVWLTWLTCFLPNITLNNISEQCLNNEKLGTHCYCLIALLCGIAYGLRWESWDARGKLLFLLQNRVGDVYFKLLATRDYSKHCFPLIPCRMERIIIFSPLSKLFLAKQRTICVFLSMPETEFMIVTKKEDKKPCIFLSLPPFS